MTHPPEYSVVLFDLGRVLMHIDFDAFPNGLGLTAPEQRAPYEASLKPFIRLYEEGKMTTEEFLDGLYAIFDCRFPKEQILESFNDIIVEDNAAIVPFVMQMRSHYRIAVLSNTCDCHWEKVRHLSSVLKLFPHLFTSFELGAMKPDPSVYAAVCSSLNVAPNTVLFIDDLEENVRGAAEYGMHGIVYRSAEQLTSDFFQKKWYRRT
ncbi:MAG: HAD family phosphatase [Bacteroidetes bacterium]|nr:HAD family phosphatase [Bacteroidota bacterium]